MIVNLHMLSQVPTEKVKRDAIIFFCGAAAGFLIGFLLSNAGVII